MIRLRMALVPWGDDRMGEHDIITAELYSFAPHGIPHHGFVIYDAQGAHLVSGRVPKTMSGHRNPLRLLKAVLAEIDVDQFPEDHIATAFDIKHGLAHDQK